MANRNLQLKILAIFELILMAYLVLITIWMKVMKFV